MATDPGEHDGLELAQRMLRSFRVGTLLFEDNLRPMRFVVDPESGRLVMPMMVAMIQTDHQVLMIPEETEDSLQLLLSVETIDEHHALVDRWRIYHGEPEDIHWTVSWIDSAKLQGLVFDGDALMSKSTLGVEEMRVVSAMNQRSDDLRTLAKVFGGMEVESPLCVGADSWGLHVKSRFDIVRIETSREARDGDDLLAMLDGMASLG
ncbi:MAG: hypothetical protein ACYTF7_10250 [Planctomycetota bacterium]|jgi:hypothetical protein